MFEVDEATPQSSDENLQFGPDYASSRAKLDQRLQEYEAAAAHYPGEYRIDFGPTYHAQSSGGIDCTVRAIMKMHGNDVAHYSLIATDPSGAVIGYRTATVTKKEHYYESSGFVFSGIRLKGISTVVDSAHVDFLRRLSTQLGKPVEWAVDNRNNRDYVSFALQAVLSHDESLQREAAVREAEQDRWQTQYGRTGRFGIEGERSRFFEPHEKTDPFYPTEENVSAIGRVELKRTESGVFDPVQVARLNTSQKVETADGNFQFFYGLLGATYVRPQGNPPSLRRP
ncbi:MAG: hypothetical protein WC775_00165 [Patescibacteria group bacterium]|jgi:hypothetical protein